MDAYHANTESTGDDSNERDQVDALVLRVLHSSMQLYLSRVKLHR